MVRVVKGLNMTTPPYTGKCPAFERTCVESAAKIISSKWTPQIIYALSNNVQRFCELQKEAGGINPRTLSARLDELEATGIVVKASFAEVPPRIEYSLTQKGRDLLPILAQMVGWGEKYVTREPEPALQ